MIETQNLFPSEILPPWFAVFFQVVIATKLYLVIITCIEYFYFVF